MFLLSLVTKLAILQISHLRQHQVNKLFEVRIEVKLLFKPLTLIFCGMDRSDHLFKLRVAEECLESFRVHQTV